VNELYAVTGLLQSNNIKSNKGLIQRQTAVEYMRGVDFHVMVLKNAKAIQVMLPSFDKDGKAIQLETLEDSVALG
jgi:hypothetical protein